MLKECNFKTGGRRNGQIGSWSKRYLAVSEAAEFLGITENDVRLRVRQGVLRPIGGFAYEAPGVACLRKGLMFDAEEIRAQYEYFQSSQMIVADGVRLLTRMAADIVERLARVEAATLTREWLTVDETAKVLRMHPVTLRKKIEPVNGNRLIGVLELPSGIRLECKKLDGRKWLFAKVDLKKIV